MAELIWIVILAAILTSASSTPECVTHERKHLVCSPGSTSNYDYVLKRGLVSDNNITESITLRGCRLSDIEPSSFENLFHLKKLDLSQNNLRKFDPDALEEAKGVTNLNLSYNLLTKFPLGLSHQITELEVLDLKGNQINELQLGIFDSLYNLKHLDLSSNYLIGENVSSYIFGQNKYISFLDFSRNDMENAPDNLLQALEGLTFLNLDRCMLTKVPAFATERNLETLTHLILSSNQITNLSESTTFRKLDGLKILDLSYNLIEFVNDDVFKPMRNLRKLNLRHNKLQVLPETAFIVILKLNSVDLSNNLLQNIPTSAFIGTSVANLNIGSNRVTYLQDNFCLELRNLGARLKKFLFSDNPWQCACLLDLMKEVKSMDIEYNSTNYNGKQPVCVTSREFVCKRHLEFNDYYIDKYNNRQ